MAGNGRKGFGFGPGFLGDVLKNLQTQYDIESVSKTRIETEISSGKIKTPETEATAEPASPCRPTADFRPGDMILDIYRVDSEAIQGGMGSVWRVHHTGWNVDLAMKRPRPEAFRTKNQKDNFTEECKHWINLGLHPNIVSCYYVREIDGVPTIFSEWMENGSLESHIKRGTLYNGTKEETEARLLDIAIQFARGLRYAHENKLIHQDVKPDNLMLSEDWTAKVSDFGLAKARSVLSFHESTSTIPEPGPDSTGVSPSGGRTPAYCSPEQAAGQFLTKQTDIYSWAVSVLEMYLGAKPWAHGKELTGPMAGYACRDYFDMCIERPVPKDLQRLLARCLEQDPDDRPEDFAIVESELTAIFKHRIGEEYYRTAPEAVSDTADTYNNRALSFLDLGEFENAVNCWEKALKLERGHRASVFNRALALYRKEKMKPWEVVTALGAIQDVGDRKYLTELIKREMHTVVTLPDPEVKVPFDIQNISAGGRLVTGLKSFLGESSSPEKRPFIKNHVVYDTVSGKYVLALSKERRPELIERKLYWTGIGKSGIIPSDNGEAAAYDTTEIVYKEGTVKAVTRTSVAALNDRSHCQRWYVNNWDNKTIDVPDGPVIREFDHAGGILNPDGTIAGFSVMEEKESDCSALFYNVRTGKMISRVRGASLLGFTWSGRVLLLTKEDKIIFGGTPEEPLPFGAPFCHCAEFERKSLPGSLLYQMSPVLAVLETGREDHKREGLLLDLKDGRILYSLHWQIENDSTYGEFGKFFLTEDGKYLVWLTREKEFIAGEKKTYTQVCNVIAQVWDMAAGKYLGRSFPYGEICGSEEDPYDFKGRLLTLSVDSSGLLVRQEQRSEYLLSMISGTEERQTIEFVFHRIMKQAEDELAGGNNRAALCLADKARECPGYESDAEALRLRAKAGERLPKKRLRSIILLPETEIARTELLPEHTQMVWECDADLSLRSSWTLMNDARLNYYTGVESYISPANETGDGRYRLIHTMEMWAHYRSAHWNNELFVNYSHYHGAAVEEIGTNRILRQYYRLYSHTSSEFKEYSTKEYETVLHSSTDGLWLLTRGDGLVLRKVEKHENIFHISEGNFQYAKFLKDDRFILAQRSDGNVVVYDLTGGASLGEYFKNVQEKNEAGKWNDELTVVKKTGGESVIYHFAGTGFGRIRYIDDDCFAIFHNGSERICLLDWEYEEENDSLQTEKENAEEDDDRRTVPEYRKSDMHRPARSEKSFSVILPESRNQPDFKVLSHSEDAGVATGECILSEPKECEYGEEDDDYNVQYVYDTVNRKYLFGLAAEDMGPTGITLSRNGKYAVFDNASGATLQGKRLFNPHTAVVDLSDGSHKRKWKSGYNVIEMPDGPILQIYPFSGGILNPDGSAVGFSLRNEKENSTIFCSVKTGKILFKVKDAILLGFTWSGHTLFLTDSNRVVFGGTAEDPTPNSLSYLFFEDIDRAAPTGSLLHQVSDQLAVLEIQAEGLYREGVLLNLKKRKVINHLYWKQGQAYDGGEFGEFHLTGDGKYLIWLTHEMKPSLEKEGEKWSCKYPYVVTARSWDVKNGKYLGRSYPLLYGTPSFEKRSMACNSFNLRGRLLTLCTDPSALRYRIN